MEGRLKVLRTRPFRAMVRVSSDISSPSHRTTRNEGGLKSSPANKGVGVLTCSVVPTFTTREVCRWPENVAIGWCGSPPRIECHGWSWLSRIHGVPVGMDSRSALIHASCTS